MTRDDEVLEELHALVSRLYREPPAESVAALHDLVARKFSHPARRPWWRRKITVGAAAFGLIAGTPAAAFALAGASLPDPLRTAMHAVGLPVESVPVADTKAAENALQQALRERTDARISKDAAQLRACLADLGAGDRARLGPRADELLHTAADFEDDQGRQTSPGQSVGGEGSGDGDRESSGFSGNGSNVDSQMGDASDIQSSMGSRDGGAGDNLSSPPGTTAGTSTSPAGSGGDGDQTATTVAPPQTPTDGEVATTTTTTVQNGSGSDGGSSTSGDTSPDAGATSSTTVERSS